MLAKIRSIASSQPQTNCLSYRRFVPLGACVRFDSRRERVDGRKVYCRARLLSLDGATVHSEAEGLFYKTNERMLGYQEGMQLFGRLSNVTKEEILAQLREKRERRQAAKERPAAKL